MRFLEIGENKEGNKKAHKEDITFNEGYKQSYKYLSFKFSIILSYRESYHLKAIELVCKYINGPCPFINHLITSYQKHYNQNLEIIVNLFEFF